MSDDLEYLSQEWMEAVIELVQERLTAEEM
jgi:hypothetical protein